MEVDRHPIAPADIAEVVITSQLSLRLTRQHDLAQENCAFRELASTFVTQPNEFLDKLVNLTLKLCDAGTVGISVEQTEEGGNKVGIEYSINRHLKVKGSSSDTGDSAVDILWRIDY